MTSFDRKDASLAEAKQWLREQFNVGARCPCCDQFTKLYKRKLNSSMAYALILIYQGCREARWDFIHVPSYLVKASSSNARVAAAIRGDWAKLKHWNLIYEQPGKRSDGSKRVGYYQITPLGASFVMGAADVPAHIYLYNGETLTRPVTKQVSIQEALGKKFSYDDLMQETT